jgi:hypothetical protein
MATSNRLELIKDTARVPIVQPATGLLDPIRRLPNGLRRRARFAAMLGQSSGLVGHRVQAGHGALLLGPGLLLYLRADLAIEVPRLPTSRSDRLPTLLLGTPHDIAACVRRRLADDLRLIRDLLRRIAATRRPRGNVPHVVGPFSFSHQGHVFKTHPDRPISSERTPVSGRRCPSSQHFFWVDQTAAGSRPAAWFNR